MVKIVNDEKIIEFRAFLIPGGKMIHLGSSELYFKTVKE
jgi:hypothetical protein